MLTMPATVIGDYLYMDDGEISQLVNGKTLKDATGLDSVPSKNPMMKAI